MLQRLFLRGLVTNLKRMGFSGAVALFTLGCSGLEPAESDNVEYFLPDGFTADELPDSAEANQEAEVIGVEGIGFAFNGFESSNFARGSIIPITVNIDFDEPTATWALFYTKDPKSLDDSVAIQKGASISQQESTWDTSFIEPGTYYFAATVESEGRFFLFRSSSSVTLSGDFEDIVSEAQIAIHSPRINRVYQVGQAVSIDIKVLSDAAEFQSMDLEVTYDSGQNWEALASNLTLDEVFVWNVPANVTARAQLRLAATGVDGQVSTVTQDGVFGISDQASINLDQIKGIIEANCASCHTGNGALGGIRLEGDNRIMDLRDQILETTRPGAAVPMPPAGPLSQADQDLIQLWHWDQ